jgi:guanine deaminase
MYDPAFMARAIALSQQALHEPGTEPFGAVVVKNGCLVGEGFNHSLAHFDPTSHGEVEAIRDACRRLETVDLSGCELYTSCEPCSVCVSAMIMAGISRMYYGASLAQSAGVVPRPTMPPPALLVREQVGLAADKRSMLPAETKLGDEAIAVLKAWVEKQ